MLEQIFGYFKTQPGWSLVITVVCTALVWLYKEFKIMLETDQRSKLTLLQKKMDLYCVVEAAAAQVISRQGDPVAIQYLYTKLKVETAKLDKEKNKLLALDASADVFDTVSRLFRPLKPISALFIAIVIAFGFLMNALQEDKYIDSICWLIAFSSTLLSLGLLTVLISLFMNNTLRIKGAYRISLTVVMITSPVLCLIGVRLAMFIFIIQLIATVLFVKSKKNDVLVVS
ncbi:hypothetical protein [Paenibacillus sp. FSL R7-0331]|uniref:hypothetical protein n=1 Tax=Paenibacillus sp. FSL R7-0331 TaxID=1536773 RepID=UPI0004F71348|nr:hypothetical protein [Paenibacillus sp. FSL R7-0331]AIQ53441.1 hypothetical protein R70331_19185 [Paenibacillus sp. FSL R7-0331]